MPGPPERRVRAPLRVPGEVDLRVPDVAADVPRDVGVDQEAAHGAVALDLQVHVRLVLLLERGEQEATRQPLREEVGARGVEAVEHPREARRLGDAREDHAEPAGGVEAAADAVGHAGRI